MMRQFCLTTPTVLPILLHGTTRKNNLVRKSIYSWRHSGYVEEISPSLIKENDDIIWIFLPNTSGTASSATTIMIQLRTTVSTTILNSVEERGHPCIIPNIVPSCLGHHGRAVPAPLEQAKGPRSHSISLKSVKTTLPVQGIICLVQVQENTV